MSTIHLCDHGDYKVRGTPREISPTIYDKYQTVYDLDGDGYFDSDGAVKFGRNVAEAGTLFGCSAGMTEGYFLRQKKEPFNILFQLPAFRHSFFKDMSRKWKQYSRTHHPDKGGDPTAYTRAVWLKELVEDFGFNASGPSLYWIVSESWLHKHMCAIATPSHYSVECAALAGTVHTMHGKFEAHTGSLEEKLNSKTKELSAVNTRLVSDQTRLAELERSLEAARTLSSSVDSTFTATGAELETLRQETREKTAQIQHMRKTVSELEEQEQMLHQNGTQLQNNVSQLTKANGELLLQVQKLTGDLGAHETLNTQLTQKLTVLQLTLKSTQNEMVVNVSALESKQREVNNLKSEVSVLTLRLNRKDAELVSVTSQRDQLQKELRTIDTKLHDARVSKEQMRKDRDKAVKREQRLQNRHEKTKASLKTATRGTQLVLQEKKEVETVMRRETRLHHAARESLAGTRKQKRKAESLLKSEEKRKTKMTRCLASGSASLALVEMSTREVKVNSILGTFQKIRQFTEKYVIGQTGYCDVQPLLSLFLKSTRSGEVATDLAANIPSFKQKNTIPAVVETLKREKKYGRGVYQQWMCRRSVFQHVLAVICVQSNVTDALNKLVNLISFAAQVEMSPALAGEIMLLQ